MKPLLLIGVGLGLVACSRSNNLLMGRVETVVGMHRVVVTDCYMTSVPPPEVIDRIHGRYRFVPCRDADVRIDGSFLTVNGKSYGEIQRQASILVDHGVVSVN